MTFPFGLPITCPRCGGTVDLVNATGGDTRQVAILGCGACRADFMVEMLLRPMPPRPRNRTTVA